MLNPETKDNGKTDVGIPARRLREVVLLIFILFGLGYMMSSCSKETTVETVKDPSPVATVSPLVDVDPNLDFTSFKHAEPQHERLPCAYCHVRQDNSPAPKFAAHVQCAGCHVQQFEDKQNGICSICHTGPDSAEMKPFPALRNFNAVFDHAKHLKHSNCTTCHKPTQNGTAFSIPNRSNSHATCYQCHTSEKKIGGKDISSCKTCHQTGRPPNAVVETAVAYSRAFKHTNHTQNCTACHSVKSGAGRGNQVTAITAAMHFPAGKGQTCASCHNNKTAFGGDDFSDCKRCHTGNGFRFP